MFAGIFGRGGAAREVADAAWLQAMLDVEAGLARACARAGVVPHAAADAIAEACRADRFDTARLGRDAAASGNPVVPLVKALRDAVPADAAEHVHRGATSQDVLDTAAMLVAKRAVAAIEQDVVAAGEACADLADRHRRTVMAARTLLQQAVPTTFGLKAAGWLTEIDSARRSLARTAADSLAVQLGGAGGTLAAFGDHGLSIADHLARELGLAAPVVPWHTGRSRPASLAGALGVVAGAMAKPAVDVALMAQSEVGEVRAGSGGSSAMPQKRNPVAAIAAIGCAKRLPALVATMQAAMLQEHERAAGAWHAEWETLSDVLRLTGSAAAWVREMLEALEVDAERMRANLDAAGGMALAEAAAVALSERISFTDAQERVAGAARRAAAENRSLRDVLLEDPDAQAVLGDEDALAPERWLGSADQLIDRALERHRS